MICELYLKNFQSVSECRLDLGRYNVVAIVGEVDQETDASNGAGKSTIGEGVLVAWFGKTDTDRDIFSYIKDDADEMEVEVRWTMHENGQDVEYRARRIAIREGRIHKRELYVAGSDKPFGGGKTETDNYIKTVLGMDFETMTAVNYFRQRKDDAFTAAKASKRKEYFKSIIGMNMYDKALKLSNAKGREIEKHLTAGTATKDAYDKELADLMLLDFDTAYKQANENLAKCADLIKQCETTKQSYQSELSRLREIAEKYLAAQKLVTSYKDRLSSMTVTTNGLVADMGAVKEQLVKVSTAKAELELLEVETCDKERLNALTGLIQEQIGSQNGCTGRASAFKDMIANIESLVNKCPMCQRDITAEEQEKLLTDRKTQVADLERRALEAAGKIEEFRREQAILKGIQDKNAATVLRRTELQGIVQQEEGLNNRLTASKETLDKLTAEEKAVQGQYEGAMEALNGLPKYDNNTAAQYEAGIQAQDAKIEETKGIENQYHTYIGQLNTKKERIGELRKLIKEIEDNSRELKRKLSLNSICSEAYSRNGIPALIIDNMFPIVEENANALLSQIDNKHKIEFSSLKTKVTGGFQEGLDIWINNLVKNTRRLYETYSGGESTFINIAIRKAISDLVAHRRYKRLPFLWMDEVFALLDAKNREAVIKCLNMLRTEFEQIFLISHTGLQHVIPDIIKAVKNKEDTVYIQ